MYFCMARKKHWGALRNHLIEKDTLWMKIQNYKYNMNGGGGYKVDNFSSLWQRDYQTMGVGLGNIESQWFEDKLYKEIGDGVDTLFWKDN